MANFYCDTIINLEQYTLEKDYFNSLLELRKVTLDNRFFLEYISEEILSQYDLNNIDSLKAFRNFCLFNSTSPKKLMGGANMTPDALKKGMRYSGIKMSDPEEVVYGVFDLRDGKLTYSPIFPSFCEERDNCKFARYKIFTTVPFQDIMVDNIDNAHEFYLHTGKYKTSRDILKYGENIFEMISKDEMISFLKKPQEGKQVLYRYLGIKE